MARFKFMLVLASACVFTLGVQELHAATLTYIVGTCKAGTRFSTIQGALNASPAPNIVEVCPGTYNEQITIKKAVTLEGISIANSAAVRIEPPSAGLATNTTINGSDAAAAHVFVENVSGPVILTNLIVDSTNNKVTSGVFLLGVFYQHSPGTVNHVQAFNQQGGAGGFGIYLEGDSANPSVTVENCTVNFYGFGGIYVVGPNGPGVSTTSTEITAAIKNNFISSNGTTNTTSMFMGSGADATVTANVTNGGAFGIVFESSKGSVNGNTFVGPGVGMDLTADGASVTANKFYNAEFDGLVLETDVNASQITGNIFTTVQTGIAFDCHTVGSPNTVHSNTFVDLNTGYENAPKSFSGSNTYIGVTTEILACTTPSAMHGSAADMLRAMRERRD